MVKFLKNNGWLILILSVAIFLRTIKLNYLELFGDEVDAGYQAYSLMATGKDYKGHLLPAYVQSFSEWRAPGMMYAMIPFIKIFGLNEWGVRMESAFFGVVSILAWYWLLNILKVQKKIRLISAAFLAIVPWQVQYSRSGYELTLMSSMLIFGTIFWIKAQESKMIWLIILSGLSFGAAIYTYNTANVYVPLLVLIVVLVYGWNWKKIGGLLAVGLFLCLPIIKDVIWGTAAARFKLFSVWNSSEVATEVINLRNEANKPTAKIFYNKEIDSASRIIFNYTNAFGSNFLFGQGDVTFRQSLHTVGNLYWIMAPLIIWGFYKTLRSKKLAKADKIMLGITLISPIPSSLTIDGYNHASRLFLMAFPLVYWSGKGLINLKKYLVLISVAALIFEFGFYQYFYWNNYRLESSRWWQTGYKELMVDIKKEKPNYQRVMIDNVYEPSLIRYLFWNQIDPKSIFGLVDKMNQKVDNYYEGFKLNKDEVYFVDFKGPIKPELLQKGTLYAFSQAINVVGDRDLNKSTPDGVKIIDTVRNYDGTPLFYLVTKI